MGLEKVDLSAAVDIGQMAGRRIMEAFRYGMDNDTVYGGMLAGRVEQQTEEISTVQNYLIGSLKVTKPPNVRKYRYCLSTGVCDPYVANQFTGEIGTGASHVGIDWSALAQTSEVGDTTVVATAPASRGIAEDELVGGLIVLNISDGTNNSTIQMRAITANTAAAAAAECTITLDRPLIRRLVGSTAYQYCMPSPYSAVFGAQYPGGGAAVSGKRSFVGYAAAEVNAAGIYHWEQTAGLISVSLYGAGVGKTQYMREVVFRYDGNLQHRGSTGAPGLEGQHAGYIVDSNVADNGATMIMLQLEP